MKKDERTGISERLKLLLDHPYGWGSISDLASQAGIPYRTMQNYLLNEREPNAEALEKIGTRCHVNLHWLLTGLGRPFLGDYLPDQLLDNLLSALTPEILALCDHNRKSILTDREKVNILGYLVFRNFRDVRSNIEALEDAGADVDDLRQWASSLSEMVADDLSASTSAKRSRKRSAKGDANDR